MDIVAALVILGELGWRLSQALDFYGLLLDTSVFCSE
jgi:hypothetical protein